MKHSIAKYSNSTMTLALLAIFVVMIAISSRYPAGARFMTFVVGLPAIALCLLQLALDARDRARAPNGARGPSALEIAQRQVSQKVGRAVDFEVPQTGPGNDEPALDPRTRVLRELTVWGYFLALIAGVLLFGFQLAVPVFLLAFLRFYAGAKWTTAVGLTATASLVIYFAFEKVLRMPLHPGLLSDQIGSLLTF
jgi:hypothetical protein